MPKAEMLLEHGLIPEEPGMERVYTIIPEDLPMNPKCPCPTRTCPNHGFCQYCLEHHRRIDLHLCAEGGEPEGVFCRRQQK